MHEHRTRSHAEFSTLARVALSTEIALEWLTPESPHEGQMRDLLADVRSALALCAGALFPASEPVTARAVKVLTVDESCRCPFCAGDDHPLMMVVDQLWFALWCLRTGDVDTPWAQTFENVAASLQLRVQCSGCRNLRPGEARMPIARRRNCRPSRRVARQPADTA